MTNRFVAFMVDSPEETFQIIDAANEEEVWNRLADIYGQEQIFRDSVEEMAVNAGLMEGFCTDSGGYLFDPYAALKPREDLRHLSEDEFYSYLDQCVTRNVEQYFKDAPHLGQLYLQRLEDDTTVFTEEMYQYCFLKQYRDTDEPWGEIFIRNVSEYK